MEHVCPEGIWLRPTVSLATGGRWTKISYQMPSSPLLTWTLWVMPLLKVVTLSHLLTPRKSPSHPSGALSGQSSAPGALAEEGGQLAARPGGRGMASQGLQPAAGCYKCSGVGEPQPVGAIGDGFRPELSFSLCEASWGKADVVSRGKRTESRFLGPVEGGGRVRVPM